MSGSAPKPRLVPTGGATAATPAAAAPTAVASAAAPAARSFGSAKPRELVLLEKGVAVQAQKRKLDQRAQQLPRINNAQQEEEEFKELESLLASAIATAASEDASVVRECVSVRACVCVCVRICCVVRVNAQSPSTVRCVHGHQVARRLAGVGD
jgi:hypothetical protein